jgi:hypothetical protein
VVSTGKLRTYLAVCSLLALEYATFTGAIVERLNACCMLYRFSASESNGNSSGWDGTEGVEMSRLESYERGVRRCPPGIVIESQYADSGDMDRLVGLSLVESSMTQAR